MLVLGGGAISGHHSGLYWGQIRLSFPHRPVGHKRQVDSHPDHDPAVGPRDLVAALAAGGERVVMPGGPHTLRPARRYKVSSTTTSSGLSGTTSRTQITASSPSPSWSGDQRATAKNRCALL